MKPATKRGFLIGLLSLTGLATLFTVAFVVFSNVDRSFGAVIMSIFGIGYLLVISLGAFSALERPGWNAAAFAGIGLSAFMMLAHPLYSWWMVSSISYSIGGRRSMEWEWIQFISRLNSLGLTLAGLLCLVPYVMAPRMKGLGVAIQVCTACGLFLSFIFFQIVTWGDSRPTEEFMRTFVALIVLTAGGLLTVAILNKFFGIKIKNPITYLATAVQLMCPRCFTQQKIAVGEGVCNHCKLKIKIDIEEPLCPICGYNLHNLTHARCPECGWQLAPEANLVRTPEPSPVVVAVPANPPNPETPHVP